MNDYSLPEILVISSYPPRECGIATYTQDLITALKNKFAETFDIQICALENEFEKHQYPDEVTMKLNTSEIESYKIITTKINNNSMIKVVLLQHEFGFFNRNEDHLLKMIQQLHVPVIITFHTVLPHPNSEVKKHVQSLVESVSAVSVMTQNSVKILTDEYEVDPKKLNVIAHGTHLVKYLNKDCLKMKYGFRNRKVLSTFGLISSGKSIETSLNALPEIIKIHPEVLFLIIGKTHPAVIKQEGEMYRYKLECLVKDLRLENNVRFINAYLPLTDLLEYLQLTDIYLFTSKDPNQAVSGTFSYAIGCGCPIISTPIPHAIEVLRNDAGMLIQFEDAKHLSESVNQLLVDRHLQKVISSNGLHRIVSTAWENVAIAHASIIKSNIDDGELLLKYTLPEINLSHIKNMTTGFGMIQFSKMNHPDIESGYTLDDNARAMISMIMHYALTDDDNDLKYIEVYLTFIEFCLLPNCKFENYVDSHRKFTFQNGSTNLDDSNGRAVWALGYLINHKSILPSAMVGRATYLLNQSLQHLTTVNSTRAIAFALKGLYYYHEICPLQSNIDLAEHFGNKLERMFQHESEANWQWFESYLTYGNSILPEGMLCAYLITNNYSFKTVAKSTFDFLLDHTFNKDGIKLISNITWMHKGEINIGYGEQPIDAAYTILALARFYDLYEDPTYLNKMQVAFDWFLGQNHLHQIIYNPCTGGCFDGLEENHINLNQGAESTISYLLSRLTIEKYLLNKILLAIQSKELETVS